MGFYVPVFGDGLQWRDAEIHDLRPRCSSDDDLDAVLPGRQLAVDHALADDSLVRARRGCDGAAHELVKQAAAGGQTITMEAARERVAVARTRAERRKEVR